MAVADRERHRKAIVLLGPKSIQNWRHGPVYEPRSAAAGHRGLLARHDSTIPLTPRAGFAADSPTVRRESVDRGRNHRDAADLHRQELSERQIPESAVALIVGRG